jgi:hypothetical protein
MNTYYTRLLHVIFAATQGLIIAFTLQSPIKGQDSFEQIEIDLRKKQSEAIENIKKHFSLVPAIEWENADKHIDFVRQEARKLFLEEPNKSYYFQPPTLKEPFKDHNELLSFLSWNKKDISISTLSSYLTESLAVRGIKQESVKCSAPSKDLISLAAIGNTKDLSYALAFVQGPNIVFNEEGNISCHFNQHIYCNIHKIKEYDYLFPIIPTVIHHELTHLVEAHLAIVDILMNTIKKYYPKIDLNSHYLIMNLIKVHELTADVVPAMICPSIAFLYCNQGMLEKLYLIDHGSGMLYPTFFELKQWAQRIITCYEAEYGKISLYNKLSFALHIPAARNLLLCASVCAISIFAGHMLATLT